MNTIKITKFLFLFTLIPLFTFGQEAEKKELHATAQSILQAQTELDIESLMQYSYNGHIQQVGKNNWEDNVKWSVGLNQPFNTKVDFQNEVPEFEVSEVYTLENENLSYAFVTYNTTATIKKDNAMSEKEKEKLAKKFKKEGKQLEYIDDRTLYAEFPDQVRVLIKDGSTHGKWQYTFGEENQFSLILLPKKLKKEVKKFEKNLRDQRISTYAVNTAK